MTAEDLRDYCLARPGAVEEFPFGTVTSVFKVNKKIFALSALEGDPLAVSVKCDPGLSESLRRSYESIVPGYHLNKRHWLTVTIGADAEDELVRNLIEDSHDLVRPKTR